ncbi:MAG TPA: hypothetical protein DD791_03045 [Syntrophomonas sp.]|jgi:iron-sulfur cluster repair protein YtfE (RIC family)|nr:hypothetical protein [Syntrophomonas sp.]
MFSIDSIKDSIKKNTRLWVALWILLILNISTVLALSRGLSFITGFIIIFITVLGILALHNQAREIPTPEDIIPPEFQAELDAMMDEMKPVCDKIFTQKVEESTTPIIENLNKDFTRGLEWLWEDGYDFLDQMDECINQTASVLNLVDSLSEEKSKLVKQIQENLVLVNGVVTNMRGNKTNSFQELSGFFEGKVDELKKETEKEKDIFYEYIYKLLGQQIKLQDKNEMEDISEYFNPYKLGEQFSVIMEKTLEGRVLTFQDAIIRELENFSADVVGGMQRNTLKLRNILQDIVELLERLQNEYWNENNLLFKRLDEAVEKIKEVEEKSADILVTLAWQDILVEKRWQDIDEKLYMLKDKVMENVESEVVNYISSDLDNDIKEFSTITQNPENMVIYKSLIDAELIYQLYSGKKLEDIITNGVYSLLQFVRPVEALVSKSVRISEEGLKTRRSIRAKVKAGEYRALFNRIQQVVERDNPDIAKELDDVFPKSFNSFCNNPYIKQKPDNLNQAAWALFLELINNPAHDDELYCLVGLLLEIHMLRNKYLHPLKNSPIDLQHEDDLERMRYAALKSIDLVLHMDIRGITRLNFRSR